MFNLGPCFDLIGLKRLSTGGMVYQFCSIDHRIDFCCVTNNLNECAHNLTRLRSCVSHGWSDSYLACFLHVVRVVCFSLVEGLQVFIA